MTRNEIERAAARIAGRVRRTPVLELDVGGRRVVAKLELLQVAGSFKPRGAFNHLILSGAGAVVAASGGNHGLAVAHAARILGRRAAIVVPASAAPNKVAAMRRLGAEVVEHGDVPGEAFVRAEALAAERGWPLVHPYELPEIVAGQGTLGLELLEQAPEVRSWLIAVGGGGLAAGVAVALDGRASVIPVEPSGCPTLAAAQRAGRPVPAGARGIARNGLGAPIVGALAFEVLGAGPPCVLVEDDAILEAQRWLWREARLCSEPAGAASLAALLSGAWIPPDDGPVGIVLCGGNADALPEPDAQALRGAGAGGAAPA
jgi:threonine dehydratase